MLEGCVTGNGGHFTAMAIRRYEVLTNVTDMDQFFEEMNRWWKEKHGHPLAARAPKKPKRVKTDNDHKWCNGCEQVLSVSAFSVDRSRARGLANRCRDCMAKSWKRANHQICKSCESWCVGQICRRCMTIQIRLRDVEIEIAGSVSFPIWKTQREFQLFAEALSNNGALSRSEKLEALLGWKPENSQR